MNWVLPKVEIFRKGRRENRQIEKCQIAQLDLMKQRDFILFRKPDVTAPLSGNEVFDINGGAFSS